MIAATVGGLPDSGDDGGAGAGVRGRAHERDELLTLVQQLSVAVGGLKVHGVPHARFDLCCT